MKPNWYNGCTSGMISYGEKDCVSCEWWIGFTMIHPDLLDLTNALHPNFAKLQVGHLQHKDLDEPLLAAQPPVLPHSKGPQASLTPCSPSRLERLDKFLEQNVHRRRHVPDVFCTVGHGNQWKSPQDRSRSLSPKHNMAHQVLSRNRFGTFRVDLFPDGIEAAHVHDATTPWRSSFHATGNPVL